MMKKAMRLTVILPMHNEEARVEPCVVRVKQACESIAGNSYEILITEDGSKDRTYEAAKKVAKGDPHITIFHSAKRLGRGAALTAALRKAKGTVSVYMDTDLSTNLPHLKQLVSRIENGAALATGSRLMPGSKAKRSLKRDVASRGFNLLVRTVLGSRLRDHQCGFKAFDTKKVQPLLREVEDTHWFWDTEMLVRAQRRNMRVDEIPVEWAEKGRGSTVDLKKDVAYMASKILYLKSRIG